MLARSVLVLVIFDAALTAPTTELFNYDSEVYDAILEDVEPFYNYEQIPINQVQTEKVTERLSGSRVLLTPGPELEDTQDEDKDEESTPRLIDGSSPQEPEFPGLLGPHTNEGDLKRIDLTSNLISEIDEDAFRKLPHLQELVLRDNKIKQLPELPATLTFIDISNNRLGRKGIKQEAFKDMYDLHHLYITDNSLDHIPLPLPESLQALHLQHHKTRGKRKPYHKEKYELGHPTADTKIGSHHMHTVRVLARNRKYPVLQLDVGKFSWGSECCTRKTRIIDVIYNAYKNERVHTKTMVKNSIVLIDSTPHRQWYESHYALNLDRKKGAKLTPEEEEILNNK
ncbi:Epiphycan [Microtus ochrogaster]|uniref:Epiphycan n=1 Tax=Microtus ochrogaster TaxID=79684 RepID=A0A8J6GKP8_MICOH|nr:Epiphycan [Microtus ochrogaster]